jgi:hypothetical protein
MLLPLKSGNVRGKFYSCCLLSSGLLARVWCSMSSVRIPIVSMKACLGSCVVDHTFSSRSDQSFSTSMKFCSGPLDLMRVFQVTQLVNNRRTVAELQILQASRIGVSFCVNREFITTQLILSHTVLLGLSVVDVTNSDIPPSCIFGSVDELFSNNLVQIRVATPHGLVVFLFPGISRIDLAYVASDLTVACYEC